MPSTARYSATQLQAFLRALDAEVASGLEGESRDLLIIGGSAASLAYGFSRATLDIDLFHRLRPAMRAAVARAKARTGLAIKIGHAAIADAPYSFEDRLRDLELDGVDHLQLRVPAQQDLIVMKLLRGAEHDLDAAETIARSESLTLEVLVSSMNETKHVIGSPAARKASFLAAIARIFGERVAEDVEPSLAVDH